MEQSLPCFPEKRCRCPARILQKCGMLMWNSSLPEGVWKMTTVLVFLNYGLVLIYGTVLSVSFAGGCNTKKQRGTVAGMCALILLAQTACFLFFGLEVTQKLYPVIAHLPLLLMLICLFKRPFWVAVTGVTTGYFCCQLPRWVGTVSLYFFDSTLSYRLSYTLALVLFLFLLQRHLAKPLYQAVTVPDARCFCLASRLFPIICLTMPRQSTPRFCMREAGCSVSFCLRLWRCFISSF